MDLLKEAREEAERCACGNHHPISIERIATGAGSVGEFAEYAKEKGWKRIGLVSDAVIHAKFGRALEESLREGGIEPLVCLVKPDEQGDVVADERSIVQVLVDVPMDADAYAVLGSGTLHDIVRFAASRTGKSFVSLPTAPSVDGFTSAGAPILLRGFKQTIQTGAPIAAFADPLVFGDSPQALSAAGYGDMIGKYTSLFDWKFGNATGGEAYCPAVERLTRLALSRSEEAAEDIASGSAQGKEALMNALLLSGLAMLLFGASHPASGGEHHLSHDWEMELLRRGARQLLHGAKVGVACAIIADKYREWAPRIEELGIPELDQALERLPSGAEIRSKLKAAGGPADPDELGLDPALVALSLGRAHLHRPGRHTALKWHNEGAKA